MRISDWSSDVCSSDLSGRPVGAYPAAQSCPQCPVSRKVPPVIMLKLYEVLTRPEVAAFRAALAAPDEIGRASCRERVCQYVSIWVVAVPLKKNNKARFKQTRLKSQTTTHHNDRVTMILHLSIITL